MNTLKQLGLVDPTLTTKEFEPKHTLISVDPSKGVTPLSPDGAIISEKHTSDMRGLHDEAITTLFRPQLEVEIQKFQTKSDWAKLNGMTQSEIGNIQLKSLEGASRNEVINAVNSGAHVLYEANKGYLYSNSVHFVSPTRLVLNAVPSPAGGMVPRMEYVEPYTTLESLRSIRRRQQNTCDWDDATKCFKGSFENGTFKWVAVPGG